MRSGGLKLDWPPPHQRGHRSSNERRPCTRAVCSGLNGIGRTLETCPATSGAFVWRPGYRFSVRRPSISETPRVALGSRPAAVESQAAVGRAGQRRARSGTRIPLRGLAGIERARAQSPGARLSAERPPRSLGWGYARVLDRGLCFRGGKAGRRLCYRPRFERVVLLPRCG
jgi:hypothetical protein